MLKSELVSLKKSAPAVLVVLLNIMPQLTFRSLINGPFNIQKIYKNSTYTYL